MAKHFDILIQTDCSNILLLWNPLPLAQSAVYILCCLRVILLSTLLLHVLRSVRYSAVCMIFLRFARCSAFCKLFCCLHDISAICTSFHSLHIVLLFARCSAICLLFCDLRVVLLFARILQFARSVVARLHVFSVVCTLGNCCFA